MKHLAIIIFPIVLIFMNACNNTKAIKGNAEMLSKNQWNLTELNGEEIAETHNQNPGLVFTTGDVNKVSGSTGCNRLSGSFELSGKDKIKFSPLAVTKMACTGNTSEGKFLEALNNVTAWTITGDQLLLSNGNTVLAKFNSVENHTSSIDVSDTTKLSGTWELDYISGPKIAFDGLYPDKKPYVYFDFTNNQLRGSTSCNGFSSKLEMKRNKIKIEDPLKTMIFCEGGGEETFISVMKKVDSYSVSNNGDTLNFMIGDVAVMRFRKK